MFDDLFSFAGDFFSGVGDVLGDVVGTVADAFSAVPSTIESLTSGMGDLLGGSSELASSSPASTLLAKEGVGSAVAGSGFGAPAAAAASEGFSIAPDPMQAIFGAPEDPMIKALSTSPTSSTLDQMITDAARGASAGQSAGGTGLINSVTNWIEKNPTAAKIAGEAIKGGFSPDPIRLAREKQQAELEAKIQLAQWLKDNNRAGGVGVRLGVAPGGGAPVQRLTGEQVYGPQGLVAQGGLIRPYMRG